MRPLSVFLIFSAISAFGQFAKQSENTLFSVGTIKVSAEEFEYLFLKNHQSRPEEFTNPGIQEYLKLYQNFKLKVAEALFRGMDTTNAFKQEFEGYHKEVRKSFEEKRDDLESLAREAYERQKIDIRASHLLLLLKPDALPEDTLRIYNKLLEIRNKFLHGDSFESLARTYSEDPSGKVNGGDLGYFTAFDMVYPFESAVFGLSKGEISMPVRTRFGFHLILCTDRKSAEGEIEVSHILIRNEKNKEAESKEKIFEISEQLAAGQNWELLCREYSQDSNTKNIGGRLKPFRRGAFGSSAPQFEEAAFGLNNPGAVSDPVETQYGWHLIRLERKIPVGTFDETRQTLIKRVSRDERSRESVIRMVEAQKKKFGFKLDDKNLSHLYSKADSAFAQGQWKFNFNAKDANLELFTLDGKSCTFKEFAQFASRTRISSNENSMILTDLMLEKFIQQKLDDAAEQALINDNPAYRYLLQEYREGILLFSIMEQEIWNKASADTAGQKQFYFKHTSRYKAGERIRARILLASEKNLIDETISRLEKGDSLSNSELKKFKSVGTFRNYGKGEHAAVDRIPWAPGFYQTEIDQQYYLIEVSRVLPPGQKSFDEARASVISDFQDELESAWLVMLRGKFPVKLNKKVKIQMFRKIISERPVSTKS
jgi:peptidyl-prolyl cis-trans isomerase SurA